MKSSTLRKLIREVIKEQRPPLPPSDKYPFGRVPVGKGPDSCEDLQHWDGYECVDFPVMNIEVCLDNTSNEYMCIPGTGYASHCNQTCQPVYWYQDWDLFNTNPPCQYVQGYDGVNYDCCGAMPEAYVWMSNPLDPAPEQLIQFYAGQPPVILDFISFCAWG